MRRSANGSVLALWLLALPPAQQGSPAADPGGPARGVDGLVFRVVQSLRAEGVSIDQSLALDARREMASGSDMVRRLKWVFAQEGVPGELVWIAEVESAFDQAATSRSGAAGLFQLMPDTARRFGLEVSATRDERRHPIRSALAAARYLKALHAQFGSWRLAVAAYHAGEGRVDRAMGDGDRGPARANPALLPEATREYVDLVFNIVESEEGVGPEGIHAPRCAAPGL